MRRLPPNLLSSLIAAALIVAACGATEPSPSRTPGAASPGAPDSTASGGTSGLSDFEARLRDATAREGQLVRALASASAGSAADLRLAIAQMREWARGERAWLAGHPADPCYDAAATKLLAAIDAIESSAGWFQGTIEASLAPSDDVSRGSMGTEAANDLQDAGQALIDAAALAKAARTGCG